MSSTNRGYDRHKSDYYVTPVEEIIKFIEKLHDVEPDWTWGKRILDPCAGGDDKNDMSYPSALEQTGVNPENILTVDIRQDSRADIKDDYLKGMFKPFDIVITNPPFSLALGKQYNKRSPVKKGIIEKAFEDVKNGGYVIMLLRLNFFGTQDRKPFWDKYMPKYCFVHHQRMGFIPEKPSKTDSIEYAHFIWQKGYYPEFTELKVI